MNAETKKFLKLYLGVAIGVWAVIAITLGPGDLSCEYRRDNKEEHDYYLQITKSEVHKRYIQRPTLNQPGMEHVPEDFAQQIAFVEEYEARDDFRRERRRATAYTVFFQFFNAWLVVWLAWRLGRKPLLKVIDNSIHELRDRIAAVKNAREAAGERKRSAKEKLKHAAEDEKRITAETEERLAREADELGEKHRLRLAIMQRELEDKKKEETHAALMEMKAELINGAVDELLKEYKKAEDDALQAALIDAFTADLEKQFS